MKYVVDELRSIVPREARSQKKLLTVNLVCLQRKFNEEELEICINSLSRIHEFW